MLRIVVFDSGWGGELVARYLEQELEIVEVIRVIDWGHAPYSEKTEMEICNLAMEQLRLYMGKVDLVVLAGYTVSLAKDFLQKQYPSQKIVGMDIDFRKILRARRYPEYVAVLMNEAVSISDMRQRLQNDLMYSTIVIPDCSNWDNLIDKSLLSKQILRAELGVDFVLDDEDVIQELEDESVIKQRKGDDILQNDLHYKLTYDLAKGKYVPLWKQLGIAEQDMGLGSNRCSKGCNRMVFEDERASIMLAIQNFSEAAKQAAQDEETTIRYRISEEAYCNVDTDTRISPDLVVLLNTHFWELKEDIEKIFGWRVRVVDFREKLLHDVCAALKLRGVHGGRLT